MSVFPNINRFIRLPLQNHIPLQGDPATPKCGFSRQIVDLFNGLDFEYGTFDILKDETVRQELKTYSNWPTYPQVNKSID